MLGPIVWLLNELITLYVIVLIVGAVLSWLVAFDVVNRRNRAVYVIGDLCYRLTEPALRPIRRFLPSLGGIDISPIILILLLETIRRYLPMLLYM